MVPIDFTFFFTSVLNSSMPMITEDTPREIVGGKHFQKNESQIIYQLSFFWTNLEHFKQCQYFHLLLRSYFLEMVFHGRKKATLFLVHSAQILIFQHWLT